MAGIHPQCSRTSIRERGWTEMKYILGFLVAVAAYVVVPVVIFYNWINPPWFIRRLDLLFYGFRMSGLEKTVAVPVVVLGILSVCVACPVLFLLMKLEKYDRTCEKALSQIDGF